MIQGKCLILRAKKDTGRSWNGIGNILQSGAGKITTHSPYLVSRGCSLQGLLKYGLSLGRIRKRNASISCCSALKVVSFLTFVKV
jgi:hypothetical protein